MKLFQTIKEILTSFLGYTLGSGVVEPDPFKIVTITYFLNQITLLVVMIHTITDLAQKGFPNNDPLGSEHPKALDKLKSDHVGQYNCILQTLLHKPKAHKSCTVNVTCDKTRKNDNMVGSA